VDYQQFTDCSHSIVAGLAPATTLKVQNYISQMRNDLLRMGKEQREYKCKQFEASELPDALDLC
jgi:hypothetical protein